MRVVESRLVRGVLSSWMGSMECRLEASVELSGVVRPSMRRLKASASRDWRGGWRNGSESESEGVGLNGSVGVGARLIWERRRRGATGGGDDGRGVSRDFLRKGFIVDAVVVEVCGDVGLWLAYG